MTPSTLHSAGAGAGDPDLMFSVVIPAHNAGRWIAQTLDSWVDQSDQRFEVIVVDDGSTDDTVAVAESYSDRLSIRILRSTASGGPARPRNLGIASARAELIVMCDADDLAHPARLERIGSAWDATGRASCILLSDFSEIDDKNHVVTPTGMARFGWLDSIPCSQLNPGVRLVEADDAFDALIKGDFHRTCSLAFTRSAFSKIGSYDESLRNAQDYDAIVRLTGKGVPLVLMPEALGLYRLAAGNISSRPVTRTAPSRIVVLNRILPLTRTLEQRKTIRAWLAANHADLAYEHASQGRLSTSLAHYFSAGRNRMSWGLIKGATRALYRSLRPEI